MLQSMKRIQVIGPKEELNRVVDLMYQAGTVHLENASEEVPSKEIHLTPVKLEAAQNIADVLSKIQAIFSTLPVIADDPERQKAIQATLGKKSYDQIIRRAREVIKELEATTRELTARKSDLTLAVTALDRYAKVLTLIQPVEKELPTLEGFEVTILLIQKEHAGVIEIIKKVTPQRTVVATDLGTAVNVHPVEGMRLFIRILLACNISKPDITTMIRDNPRWLLGLDGKA